MARPWTRKFLGYTFTPGKVRIKISDKSIDRMKDKVRRKLRPGKGESLRNTVKELRPLLRGWINYFKLTEVPTPLRDLDEWIRRKLRKTVWKQLKKPWTRAQALIKRGVSEELARRTAKSHKGAWRNVRNVAMHLAYPNSYFEEMGLISLLQVKQSL